jgi:hypothetical protein
MNRARGVESSTSTSMFAGRIKPVEITLRSRAVLWDFACQSSAVGCWRNRGAARERRRRLVGCGGLCRSDRARATLAWTRQGKSDYGH